MPVCEVLPHHLQTSLLWLQANREKYRLDGYKSLWSTKTFLYLIIVQFAWSPLTPILFTTPARWQHILIIFLAWELTLHRPRLCEHDEGKKIVDLAGSCGRHGGNVDGRLPTCLIYTDDEYNKLKFYLTYSERTATTTVKDKMKDKRYQTTFFSCLHIYCIIL